MHKKYTDILCIFANKKIKKVLDARRFLRYNELNEND